MTIRQRILFTAAKVAALIDEPMPATGPDQVLVEMDHTVVSNGTERACLLGMGNTPQAFPIGLGYAGAGVVSEVGARVTGFRPGDRALVYHGKHASHNLVAADQLTKVEHDDIPSLEAAFVIIAAMSLGGVRKLELEIGHSVMVMGQGILGLFATRLAKLNGAHPVIAVDPKPDRRATSVRMGADHALDPTALDLVEQVRALIHDAGVNAVVEVTGAAIAMQQALACTARQGRVALLGCTRVSDCPIDYYRSVHRPGISLIGAHNLVRPQHESYPHHWTHHDDCTTLLDLIAGDRLSVKPVISGVLPPQDAPGFYRRLADDEHVPTGMAFAWR